MKFTPQHDRMDCGPACLKMVLNILGKDYPIQYLRKLSHISKEGVSLLSIRQAADELGVETIASKININTLNDHGTLPCILHWKKKHFVVLYDVKESIWTKKRTYKVADPAYGLISLSESEFEKLWRSDEHEGIALFVNPTQKFHDLAPPAVDELTTKHLLKYVKPYRKQLFTMFLLLLVGSALTLVFPFLTEALIDKGVNAKNLNFIFIILLAQLGVFLGSIIINIFRNWLMLYIGTHLSINIISEFLQKVLKLPINFFDSKMIGDFSQRIADNERIEQFLTSNSLLTFFSIITFSVFFGVLFYYDYKILLVYLVLTALSVLWSVIWLKKRKMLDYYRFQKRGENQEIIYEMINGVSEMKINQFEDFKRKEWEKIQQKLFKINMRFLKIDQMQLSGFEFINQLKNIIVTFLAASFVVKGHMTLGALLSVSYIIGQMNSPINQLVDFFRSLQDAKLSLVRLNEVHEHAEEESEGLIDLTHEKYAKKNGIERGIYLKNVSFQYEGPQSPYVLKNINMFIPEGKITAIVGASGSGKTTLMKMLLKFYDPVEGDIYLNHANLKEISPRELRKNCGVVMQDGYIFSDTIERNIGTSDEIIDESKMKRSLHIANIQSFVDELPLGLNTKIGASGNGISGGQKQRILISRAVYKDPHFILFDEATSALDADNEKVIHDNLQEFFKGKTVIIIAHRLSTVKNADNIVVLKKGEIVEQGSHQELVNNKANYYHLVKNQLELG
ncbi:ABC transporter ATP-binding protein [Chryseobacterium lactis]|uniref:ABC transporter ATP-binding protein n=1 Tax=Chryseobacterium lactis TaxID=1241981 RepID=A0A3G6RKB9_CHRLC|nr:peptidase domain-containing ABC transporter [Chryseobacterium lactis]AZA84270.1 peptidase domain-containing ABC transporter [Chryseobacterium lactis]AZB04658.1 peptidase domain-containing ABC transporter [Chryseobacterium lactis]PNW14389.1 ABC transporter ATP-binding protein [Chryseobacterium lactis]